MGWAFRDFSEGGVLLSRIIVDAGYRGDQWLLSRFVMLIVCSHCLLYFTGVHTKSWTFLHTSQRHGTYLDTLLFLTTYETVEKVRCDVAWCLPDLSRWDVKT